MVNATLYLLHYNNYYNRIYKSEDSLEGYLPYQLGQAITNVNFIPNDYVNTTQVINWNYAELPDYLLVVDENTIVSKWFVISNNRVRRGQYILELHRDLISDYYLPIVNAPMFIEKATVPNLYDPAIYNKENMSFNQIKVAEYPIKDKSRVAWIVGYVPRDSFTIPNANNPKDPKDPPDPEGTTITANYDYQGYEGAEEYSSFDKYDYYNYSTEDFIGLASNINYDVDTYAYKRIGNNVSYYDFSLRMNQYGEYEGAFDFIARGQKVLLPFDNIEDIYSGNRTYEYKSNTNVGAITDTSQYGVLGAEYVFKNFSVPGPLMSTMNSNVLTELKAPSEDDVTKFLNQNGKIIKVAGIYYKVNVITQSNLQTKTLNLPTNSAIYRYLNNNINTDSFTGFATEGTYWASADFKVYRISFETLSSQLSIKIAPPDKRYHLNDSPYDMFCLPFPEEGQKVNIYKNRKVYIENINRDAAFSIATSITTQLGKGNLYDLQLLPYCPIPNIITNDFHIDVVNIIHSDVISESSDGTTKPVSILLWATSSKFTLNVPVSIAQGATVLDKKIRNETEMWRLCSPNYSGVFEFNPQKNNGVTMINIDCHYKPFNPYIHLNIDFRGLYGKDFNDSRGLICGGDFSLPITTDAWADYQLNNKNYEQMFAREIQNLEVGRNLSIANNITGILTGAVPGGIAVGQSYKASHPHDPYAFNFGGPPVDVQGARLTNLLASGLIAKGVGSIANTVTGVIGANETIDYKKDMFGYQMDNIQALPQGLAKVSAFTANNKIFPFLEKYDCTEIEKEALKNKIKYNGMTIMRIGTISQFVNHREDGTGDEQSYIKGKLIRVDSINDDFHICNAIAEELDKGVFM